MENGVFALTLARFKNGDVGEEVQWLGQIKVEALEKSHKLVATTLNSGLPYLNSCLLSAFVLNLCKIGDLFYDYCEAVWLIGANFE